MTDEIFLGVDGGGTKTLFLLEKNGEKFESKQKTIHPKQVSKEEYFEIMEKGINEVLNKAGISPNEITYTFVASPGYGQFPETEAYTHEGIRRVLRSDKFTVANDCVNGWAGSLNAKEGINIVIGTGAIGYGRDKNGNSMICSGWGPFLGDEASGYWIGMKLLNLFTKMSDGRYIKTSIYDMVKEKLGLKKDYDILEVTANMKREEIAALSVILTKALEENDIYAYEILDQLTNEISLIIETLIKNLDFSDEVDVSFSGGVSNIGEILYQKVRSKVKSRVNIVKPFASPADGALILAKEIYKGNISL